PIGSSCCKVAASSSMSLRAISATSASCLTSRGSCSEASRAPSAFDLWLGDSDLPPGDDHRTAICRSFHHRGPSRRRVRTAFDRNPVATLLGHRALERRLDRGLRRARRGGRRHRRARSRALLLSLPSRASRSCLSALRARALLGALLMQITGLSAATGILAIALPYAGIFAKVFAEILEEADKSAENVLPHRTAVVARFVFARFPVV